ncbi:FabD/lysophospholipase-like protein [Pseudovirgaria hyperparasitica]|uniref:FabD/lysophospholipase-like protein n=1 Tax=Pseudovirgaria hyperparasitica TaxID=470096 RepID=A0A6A6VQI7_9PEZI|nr:FabD/lysophospholipase-like protein [Pseudovirgaria hyperparasitica]KAF2752463.1 FabD/lysophospholipase-like protein [Pseudovirgaria hyperparasitica]
MPPCKHSSWLGAKRVQGEPTLIETDRLSALLSLLHNLDTQYPIFLVTIGDSEKGAALRTLFGFKASSKGRRSIDSIHLYLDSSTTFTERPWIVAEGRSLQLIPHTTHTEAAGCPCHRTNVRSLRPCDDHIATDVYARLLRQFTNLERWCDGWSVANQQHIQTVLGQPLVVVTERPNAKNAKRDSLSLVRQQTSVDIHKCISNLEFVALLPRGTISPQARFRRLKELLQEQSRATALQRADRGCLYSARHFSTLLNSAIAHFTESSAEPLDCVIASRATRPVPSDLGQHLANVFALLTSTSQLAEFAVPMLASCLFLDSYPPDSHCFEPSEVFSQLYARAFDGVCPDSRVIAFSNSADVLLRTVLLQMLQEHFQRYFAEHSRPDGLSAVAIHQRNLKRFCGQWGALRSERTCLGCTLRTPQYALECSHMLCENCVVIHGEQEQHHPYLYRVCVCPLCHMGMQREIRVRVHPPTAGVSILCIDGGGTRGIVPLTIMQRIQDCIGLPIPFQQYFKLAFGVSSGGLIVMNMFFNGSTIEESTQLFKQMAVAIFNPRKSWGLPVLSRFWRSVMTIFADGLYPVKDIESVLKKVFHPGQSILGASFATAAGTRIGLPVATVHTHPACRIFTNYNGVGARLASPTGEPTIRAEDGFGKVPQWEVARAISAAPGFFPAAHIDQVGTFQDAGPLENNPLSQALSEMRALFPYVAEPDMVLSLGTGEPAPAAYEADKQDRRSLRKSGMFTRARDLLLEKMRDGTVRRVLNGIRSATQTAQRIHRLNIHFEGSEPRLDDTAMIPSLASLAAGDVRISGGVEAVAHAAVASLFYFELDRMPQGPGESLEVAGSIRCVLGPADDGFDALIRRLAEGKACFMVDVRPLPGVVGDRSFADAGGRFCKRIEFVSRGKFTLWLKLDDATTHISGSPFSIDRLIKAQGLDAQFGRADHQKRKASFDHNDVGRRKKQRSS